MSKAGLVCDKLRCYAEEISKPSVADFFLLHTKKCAREELVRKKTGEILSLNEILNLDKSMSGKP